MGKNTASNRKHSSQEEKKAYYHAWKKSTLSKPEFCRQHQLCVKTFYRWVKKIESKASISSRPQLLPVKPSSDLNTPSDKGDLIQLLLPNGYCLRFKLRSGINNIAHLAKELAHGN